MASFNEATTTEESFLSQRALTKTGCAVSAAYADNDAVVKKSTRITLFMRLSPWDKAAKMKQL
jgi:hypothetical protein